MMSNIIKLIISFLLVALAASSVAGQDVLDVNQNPIKPNTPYYIKAIGVSEPGRWISRHRVDMVGTEKPCPESLVVSGQTYMVPREPVMFLSSSDSIQLSNQIRIKFTSSNHCEESGFWTVTRRSELQSVVTLNGSGTTDDGLFTIERHEGLSYKLKFVTTEADESDVGASFEDSGERRILVAVLLGPLGVTFVPA